MNIAVWSAKCFFAPTLMSTKPSVPGVVATCRKHRKRTDKGARKRMVLPTTRKGEQLRPSQKRTPSCARTRSLFLVLCRFLFPFPFPVPFPFRLCLSLSTSLSFSTFPLSPFPPSPLFLILPPLGLTPGGVSDTVRPVGPKGCALAHGQQVVLSATQRELWCDEKPLETEWAAEYIHVSLPPCHCCKYLPFGVFWDSNRL